MLAHAKDYREFLNLVIVEMESETGRGVKATICRKAGFGSRSYLSEILSGKKGLSRDAMLRLKTALKLTGSLAKLFEALVIKEHPMIEPKTDLIRLNQKITELRGELKNLTVSSQKNIKPDLNRPEFFQIYAALGAWDKGASLDEISNRTGLSTRIIKSVLLLMIKKEIVELKQDRYFALSSKVDDISSKDFESVSLMVRKVCSTIHRNSAALVKDEVNLNLYSAFSIRRDQMPKLKKALQKAVFDVLDEYQDDNGDCVEQIFLSSFRTPMEIHH